jgi:hypothetical protein
VPQVAEIVRSLAARQDGALSGFFNVRSLAARVQQEKNRPAKKCCAEESNPGHFLSAKNLVITMPQLYLCYVREHNYPPATDVEN